MPEDIYVKSTYICDVCVRYGEKDTDGPFDRGSLHIRRTTWSTPLRLEGIGGRSRTYDLCRICINSINRTTEADESAKLRQWLSN